MPDRPGRLIDRPRQRHLLRHTEPDPTTLHASTTQTASTHTTTTHTTTTRTATTHTATTADPDINNRHRHTLGRNHRMMTTTDASARDHRKAATATNGGPQPK